MPRASHYHPQVRCDFHTDVELVPLKGTHYRDAFIEAIYTASRLERTVYLTFNGVRLTVAPGSTVESLSDDFSVAYKSPRDEAPTGR